MVQCCQAEILSCVFALANRLLADLCSLFTCLVCILLGMAILFTKADSEVQFDAPHHILRKSQKDKNKIGAKFNIVPCKWFSAPFFP